VRVLVLGLGNDLAADDAVGLAAVRAVRGSLDDPDVDVVESAGSGLALLEHFDGYDRAVVVDAIATGRRPPGTIVEMGMQETGRVVAPSAHQAGLPELAAVAERLGLGFPARTRVLAVEVADPYTLGAPMGEAVAAAVPEVVRRIREQVLAWREEEPCTTCTPSTR
jgi:hydrogenase maturation protease